MNLTKTFCAFALAAGCQALPASAQTIFYEDGDYLYAVPAQVPSADDAVAQTGVETVPVPHTAQRIIPTRSVPAAIVLPDTAPTDGRLPIVISGQPYGSAAQYAYPPSYQAQRSVQTYAGAGADYAGYPGTYAQGYPTQTGNLPNGAQLVQFDQQAWLSECRNRLSAYDRNDRARVIGALGGAVLGGFVGNRIADGNRLAGTLAGAGVGALAGSAVGDSIDDRADRRALAASDDYCAAYLDDYLTRASNSGGAASYTAGQQYMLVPVTVPVAQQVVYREYVAPAQ